MTDAELPAANTVVVRDRPLWLRILKWIGIAIVALLLLVVVLVFALNTGPGRGFLVSKLDGYTTASGLKVNIGRIDGSLYGAMTIRDLRLSDTRGVFADSPAIALDWRPFAFANSHVDIRSLTSPLVRYARNPVLKDTPPGDPNAPLLPDYDIDVNRLRVDRIEVGPAVTGQRHIARLDGEVHIADRRAQVTANAATIAAPGVAGGDSVALKPGGLHLMFLDLHDGLKAGETVQGSLEFERAGRVPVTFTVAPIGAQAPNGQGTASAGEHQH